MLHDADVAALVEARHPDPFAVLGLHADTARTLWLRAMLPGTTAVAVVDAASSRCVAVLAYGGSNVGNGDAALAVEATPSHCRSHSIVLTVSPLATLFLLPA